MESTGPNSPLDRLISAAIGALCGFFFGRILGFIVVRIFDAQMAGIWTAWILTIAFGLFGLVAPGHSRNLWTTIWAGFLRFVRGLIDTRRFYR